MGKAAVVFAVVEMSFGLRRPVIVAESQVGIARPGIDHLAWIHLPLRIPDGFEIPKGSEDFLAVHHLEHVATRLPVPMLAGKRASVAADDYLRSLRGEAAIFPDALARGEVKIDARMNATLTEVTVKRAVVAILFEKFAQIAQIIADSFGRHR